MKRKLLLGFMLCFTLVMTGCIGSKPYTEKEVLSYLEETYPGEEFTVVSRENTKIACYPSKKLSHDSYITRVGSRDTQIEFDVSEVLVTDLWNSCAYNLIDNYIEKAIEKYQDQYEKAHCRGIWCNFNVEEFASNEELAQYVIDMNDELMKYVPFSRFSSKHDSDLNFGVSKDGETLFSVNCNKNLTYNEIMNEFE